MADVSIAACADYSKEAVSRAFDEVLAPIGGLDWVTPGMKIAIKANLVTFFKPDKAATTHPALIDELARRLTEKGAEVVIGDSPGGPFNHAYLERVYNATGMKALEREGVAVSRNFAQKDASFPEGKVCRSFQYTAYLDDADAIIDFCKLKSHGMMGLSGAVKNMFGAVPGTIKPEYHYRFPDHDDFAEMLVDLNEYFKPVLSLCDAVECMEGNGPTMGTPKHIGALLASRSPYALDLACSRVIGIEPGSVPVLRAAVGRGFIPDDSGKLDISGDIGAFVCEDFDIVKAPKSIEFKFGNGGAFSSLVSKVMSSALTSVPSLKKSECVGCAKCAEICPANAIEIKKGKAVIDRDKCIRCFCCQEFCPTGAMKVHRPLIARIAKRL